MGTLALLAVPFAASGDARHHSTRPYVLGAVVIAILSIALMVQLIGRMKRARRR